MGFIWNKFTTRTCITGFPMMAASEPSDYGTFLAKHRFVWEAPGSYKESPAGEELFSYRAKRPINSWSDNKPVRISESSVILPPLRLPLLPPLLGSLFPRLNPRSGASRCRQVSVYVFLRPGAMFQKIDAGGLRSVFLKKRRSFCGQSRGHKS